MTNADVELRLKNTKKEELNLSVGEFVLRSNENRKSNQRKFVQKFCEEAYKDSKQKHIICNRNIGLLSSFLIEKGATCENREMKKDQAMETNTIEKMSNSKEKEKNCKMSWQTKSNKTRDVSEISDEKAFITVITMEIYLI